MLSLLYAFQAKKVIEGDFLLAGRGEIDTDGFLSFKQQYLCTDNADAPTKYVPCDTTNHFSPAIYYIPADLVKSEYTPDDAKKFVKSDEVILAFEIDERNEYFAIDSTSNAVKGYDTKKMWVATNGSAYTGYEILLQVIFWIMFALIIAIFIYVICFGCCGGNCACCNSVKSVFPVRGNNCV